MSNDKYKQTGEQIIEIIGKDNIESMTHCATRLRFSVKDKDSIDTEAIEELELVKGVFYNSGQFQVILGTGIVNKVYKAVTGDSNEEEEKQPDSQDQEDQKPKKGKIQRGVRTLADVFIPIIPGIVATGLFLGLKGVLLNESVLGFFGTTPDAVPESILALITVLTDTVFAFLPALICWSAFKKFGGTPVIGFVIGLMLVSPALPNAYEVADATTNVEPLMAFGFIPIVGYQGSVLTALVVGIIASKVEIKLRAKMPDSLDLMFTPFFVILVGALGGLLVLGPVLHIVESGLVYVVNGLIHVPFGIGGFIIGLIYPLAVITGMHHLFLMIETTLLASTGFNPLITLCAMYGFANAAVCFAISRRSKKKNIKVMGTSAGITQLLGVSEPALFGIIIRYGTRPLTVMLLSSALGGMVLSILGVQANAYGLAVILSPLMYIYSGYQFVTYIIVGVATFILAFILASLFAVPKELLEPDEKTAAKNS
ncbi:PTS transporter subunit EIIC [Oceanobacillus jeddahense]|uniref:PTS transporter subunit EIIC n=1 Tax=Oceanobacillus jeddahense TaxID=1462527 RepID=A0ABY5JTS5_9BACI|nr:PTS transporter subunit EIIC [Oceanobacillus jeddahense]UUI03737.1 PTS transporter subunit EIIC [Oceanobacillus jeddahense]